MISRENILGIRISRTNYEECIDEIAKSAKDEKYLKVSALAVHGLMIGVLNKEFGKRLNSFDLLTPDGQPLRWTLNLLGLPRLKDRVYGPILTLKVCEKCEEEGIPIYLYGSKPEVVRKLAENLKVRYPFIKIVGIKPSRFRFASIEEDMQDIQDINNSGAKVVFIGLGCPLQENWAFEHKGKVKATMICVGAAFDFICGNKSEAPKWMQRNGLEWLFRLSQEPGRLWYRYLVYNPLFVLNLLLQWIGLRRFQI